MNKTEYFLRMFAYDDWATREILDSLKSSNAPPAKSLKILSHIISAMQLWLDRLNKVKQSMAVWPELSFEESESRLAELSLSLQKYLNLLHPADYSSQVAYVNSLGEAWESSVEDMLMQLLMHSSYHRGQIAFELRACGQTPPYTDFIHAVRQGFIKQPADTEKQDK